TIKGRQLELLIYLLKYKKTTYGQLAQHFEVSIKTIERDINQLSGMGIPVCCFQGAGGGVRLDENYKFSTSFFTEQDIHQIIFALKIMNSLSDAPDERSILSKLCLIAPELSAMFESDAEKYLSIDLLSRKLGDDDRVCKEIDYCLDEEVCAVLNGTLRVAPIGYVLKPDGLYLFCFSDSYQLIACRDIATLKPTAVSFERNFISYEEYKKNSR
ncbi:MAG: HTH domain-containing protein, partial [Pygmaiobacter sp.]